MPTTLTPYQLQNALAIHRQQMAIIKSCNDDETLIALEHMQAEFKLLEEYQQGLITTTEFYITLATLIENRYRG